MSSNIITMGGVKSLRDIDITGKKVLIRVDFNVPMDGQFNISDDSRIRAALPTINYCIDHKVCSITLVSHLGQPKGGYDERYTLRHILKRLERLLEKKIEFIDNLETLKEENAHCSIERIFLLENIRFFEGEKKNDPVFCQQLADLCDVYVNDAFGTSHRKDASTYGIADYAPIKVAGFLMMREIEAFSKALENPIRPIALIVGGSKISSKITLLTSVMPKIDKLIIGGAMSNTFLKALGYDMKASLVEDDYVDIAKDVLFEALSKNVKVYLPVDVVSTDSIEHPVDIKITPVQDVLDGFHAVDIGPATLKLFSEAIELSNTIIWNGPMGIYEISQFSKGTFRLASIIADSYAFSIVGGGDTADAVEKAGEKEKFSFISTGGGASLELLEGKILPGFEKLDRK
ncbi:MAG: phosphoglycerate kinase [Sulfuricurvum sp.]|uniref:phosphoglycerate kinase n=1 Tax=Sulfuricurvum sp. TaxID=2025608 RepID=UPI0026071381|nr:phosphoglycerate kinase [Sulfuricurvum sp.]MDD2829481.1 phosphoglycerate kinase [Sulfuricurvum sp.]MDD4949522.1 phosphoglycerate kinase [Sulfuricurvum sp.]